MLFNSYTFLFAFLPVALGLFLLLGRRSRSGALAWLIIASLVFYAWWRPINVLIIAPSILVNYVLARRLARPASSERLRNALLAGGIAFNIAFLGYFKYTYFAVSALNDIAGTRFVFEQVILPLGISFITFQKIAFLVDVWSRRVADFTLREYALFVLFFPQLIAGPIVHFREVMPQFRAAACRPGSEDLAVGLSLLAFGLFKKVVLADSIAAYASPVYAAAAAGQGITLVQAWIAALGFTLQIYFDFSGYSDMALGLARCFGIRLPPNFDSPLKATNIVDFWLRWHMTLTRFLTAYLYNPLVLGLTRRRLARGKPAFGGRNVSLPAFVQLLALPTLATMLVSGVWHGAGYTFIVWGLLHGAYLVVNHAWRTYARPRWRNRAAYERTMRPLGAVLTLLWVTLAMVIFRAPTLSAAAAVLRGLAGGGGVELPATLVVGALQSAGIVASAQSLTEWAMPLAWLLGLLAIALLLPNTLQLMSRYEPALGVKPAPTSGRIAKALQWQPNLAWLAAVAALAVTAIVQIGGTSEFLYWQF